MLTELTPKQIAELPNFSATAYRFEAGDRRFGDAWVVLEHFEPEPECLPNPDVPKGAVTEYGPVGSEVFPGTLRGYWLYVPAQYDPDGDPAALMVFQDGGMYLSPQAPVPPVFDNLIAAGEMPVTVGLFVNPGSFPDREGRFQNRITEYHDRTDAYARFLRDEMIPRVGERVHLRDDADGHAIAGLSSGAVCAFNAAWQMPDLFSKVLSHCGSFTNINGSHHTWAEVRMADRKPLRVWQQDGTNDIDDVCGNWWLANQELAAALRFRGYDAHFDWGRGFHSLAHGGTTLPSALRWLWRPRQA
jgi:enterochelin esterase-like enzyme